MVLIGRGISEGYTELLVSRLYNKNNKVTAYHTLVKIVQMMELLFEDADELMKLYFNHNLPGLIKYLESYAPRDEVIRLIIEIDKLEIYGISMNFMSVLKAVNVQTTLYKWFTSREQSLEKRTKFEELVSKNLLVSMVINKKQVKLYRESSYENKNELENSVRKKVK